MPVVLNSVQIGISVQFYNNKINCIEETHNGRLGSGCVIIGLLTERNNGSYMSDYIDMGACLKCHQ